jgi:hypothetical protein
MPLSDSLKAIAHQVRAIPGTLGLRPYTVESVITTRALTYGLQGAESTATVAITEAGGQPPKVRFLSPKELAIGELATGSVDVGPITPDHTGGGTVISVLNGSSLEHKDIKHFKLTGPHAPNGQLYRLVSVRSDHALHYMLTLSPVASS